jgi:hypothetical protein
MIRHSISKRRMLVGTRWTPSNRRRPFSNLALQPFPSDLRVARAVDYRHVPAGPPHHSWCFRRARRAKLVSSGCPPFAGFVVRWGPATGIRSSKARTPTSRPGEADDLRFHTKITSPSRLPLSRSRTRHDVGSGPSPEGERGAGVPLPGFSCSTLDASCIQRTSAGTPFDRAPHSTSHRPFSRDRREATS